MKKPDCPICNKNKDVISDGNSSATGSIPYGISKDAKTKFIVISEGNIVSHFYCKKCFCDFDIEITYKKYSKDRPFNSGNTGCTG